MSNQTTELASNDQVEYRDIPGFPGYQIGNDGTVWSRKKRGAGAALGLSKWWRKIAARTLRRGHQLIFLSKMSNSKNDGKYILVHRLVLTVFVGPCPDGMECCHYDGNPKNNHISNLRWDTHKSNMGDMVRHNKNKPKPKRKPILHGRNVRISAKVVEMIYDKYEIENVNYSITQTVEKLLIKAIRAHRPRPLAR